MLELDDYAYFQELHRLLLLQLAKEIKCIEESVRQLEDRVVMLEAKIRTRG